MVVWGKDFLALITPDTILTRGQGREKNSPPWALNAVCEIWKQNIFSVFCAFSFFVVAMFLSKPIFRFSCNTDGPAEVWREVLSGGWGWLNVFLKGTDWVLAGDSPPWAQVGRYFPKLFFSPVCLCGRHWVLFIFFHLSFQNHFPPITLGRWWGAGLKILRSRDKCSRLFCQHNCR